MKKNYEELNYRFKKELLNNYGYSLYFSLLHDIESSSVETNFNYAAWVKGLFKTDGVDDTTLVESFGMIYAETIEVSDEEWQLEYKRRLSVVDIINIPELVSSFVKLYFAHWGDNPYLWKLGLSIVNNNHSENFHEFIDNAYKNHDENVRVVLKTHNKILKDWAIDFLTNSKD